MNIGQTPSPGRRIQEGSEKSPGLVGPVLAAFALNQFVETFVRVFTGAEWEALCRWDCGWYGTVVADGYWREAQGHAKGDAANWAFFPLFPLAARAVGDLTGVSIPLALVWTSKLFFVLALYAFGKMAAAYLPDRSPTLAVLVAALNPYAVYGNAGYTESLFLFLTATFFWQLRERKFLFAGAIAAALSAVRLTGVFAAFTLLIEGVRQVYRQRATLSEMLVALLLAPLGLGLFALHLYDRMGDALAFVHVQRAWNRIPENPLVVLWQGMIATPLELYWAMLTITALGAIALLGWRREWGLVAFSLPATLVPLSTGLWAMPRYLFWQAPLLLVLVELCAVWPRIFLPIFAVAQAFLYWAWFQGAPWMV